MRKKKVLVSIEHSGGTAGIFVDRAGRWRLSGYLDERGGTRLKRFKRAKEGIDGDRLVHGGRLPPGATNAMIEDAAGREHVAAVANGAWVAITNLSIFADFPVRFTDDEGAVVAAPGGTDDERAFGVGGVVFAEGLADPGGEAGAREAQTFEEARALEKLDRGKDARVLKRVRFPVYAVRGRPAELAGWGSSGRRITNVKVLHGADAEGRWLRVESQRDKFLYPETEEGAARFALELLDLTRGGTRDAASAGPVSRSLDVDGKPVTFTVLTSGPRWCAVASPAEDTRITLTASGLPIDGVELVTLDDPLSLL